MRVRWGYEGYETRDVGRSRSLMTMSINGKEFRFILVLKENRWEILREVI